jgi:hypothetical protein
MDSGVRNTWRWQGNSPLRVQLVLALLLLGSAPAAPLRAQNSSDSAETPWFVGAYYRYNWMPGLILAPFFERAPTIANNGFGATVSHRSRGGVTAELGLGYLPYRFAGAFHADGTPIEDTEYVRSKLAFFHVTGSLLWPIELHRLLNLEIGVGVDIGALVGAVERTEAFPDAKGAFHACNGALQPPTTGPNKDLDGMPIPYCEQAVDRDGKVIASNAAGSLGAQYHARERRIPPVMLFPMLPHLALRFAPYPRLAFKLEAAFGLAQIWVGLSVHVGLGATRHATPESAPAPPPSAAAKLVTGRVLGKLFEHGTDVPIARASVKTPRSFSAVETDSRGLFVFENIPPGPVRFDISHMDYEAGSCEATIAPSGGDSFVHCFLAAKPREGAISGQVKDEQGNAVAHAHIDITGPIITTSVTEAEGLFALPDAPEGTYRVRVTADGFLIQLIEIDVRSRETALPQIILIRKPAK